MRRATVFLATVLLLALPPIAASADTGGHPLSLWLAEGAHNRIYLLGSVHMLRESDHPLPSVIDSVYDDAESLVMEIDMDDIDAAASLALVTKLGVIHDAKSLRDLMGNDLYDQAAQVALELDIPLEMLAKTEPWLAAMTVSQLVLNRIGFNPQYGVEMHLSAKAGQDGKEIRGFESVEEQLNFLDGLSLNLQRDLLMQALAEGSNIQSVMSSLIEAWRIGDLQFLEENMLAEIAKYPELYRSLVVDRNQRWVEDINTLLDDDDDYLIVVGALHLVGDDGLPEMLSRKGVRVSQMHQPE